MVSSANFMIWLLLKLTEQSCVSSVNGKGLSTHPYGDPVLYVVFLDVMLPTLTVCRLSVKKSMIQLHMSGSTPSNNNFSMSCCGNTVLKVELKSISRILA